MVHNETTTGVTSDIKGVRAAMDAADHPALLLVDGVSSIGALEFKFDDWGVDVAVTGSQKALSLPTGLGLVCASDKVCVLCCAVLCCAVLCCAGRNRNSSPDRATIADSVAQLSCWQVQRPCGSSVVACSSLRGCWPKVQVPASSRVGPALDPALASALGP